MPTQAQLYENDLYDIYNMLDIDPAENDFIPIGDASDSENMYKTLMAQLLAFDFCAQGRLTLSSSDPYPYDSNLTAQTTLYYLPFVGNMLAVYDGTAWIARAFTSLSLSLSGYTANKNYDIWVYDDSGTLTLDSTVWTNDSTRATALAYQDSILVKSGDATRRYLGTIRITGSTGQCEDSRNKRFVWNYYNRMPCIGHNGNTNTSWTYSTIAVWRELNNGSGQVRFECVIGVQEEPIETIQDTYFSNSSSCNIGSIFNSTTSAWQAAYIVNNVVCLGTFGYNMYASVVWASGYNWATQTEYCQGSTMTVYGYHTVNYHGYTGANFLHRA